MGWMAFFALRRIQSTLDLRNEISNPDKRISGSDHGDRTSEGERTGAMRSAEVALLEATVDLLGLKHVQDPHAVGPGSFLLTHPTSCITQPVLHQAVILLTDGNNRGISGVVLSRPTQSRLAQFLDQSSPLQCLGANQIYRGGDCLDWPEVEVVKNLVALHPYFPDLPDTSVRVAEGLYMTPDLEEAANLVKNGVAESKDFKLFFGYCGWQTEQLSVELERGVWFAASPTKLKNVADAHISDAGQAAANGSDRDVDGGSETQLPPREGEGRSTRILTILDNIERIQALHEPEEHVWAAMLRGLGGEFGGIAVLANQDTDTFLSYLGESIQRQWDAVEVDEPEK